MDVNMAVKFVYPRLYRIHDMSDEVKSQTKFLRFIDTHMITSPLSVQCGSEMENGVMKLPDLLWPSAETLCQDGVFLLDCGIQMFLLLCDDVSPDILSLLFGIDTLRNVNTQVREYDVLK